MQQKLHIKVGDTVKKHAKPSAADPQGGIIEKEGTIHVSNLMVVANGTASRTGRKADAKGKLVRYSKKTGEEIK
jgi:large subunit ribosomal protein L24